MAVPIPTTHLDLIEGPYFAVFTTIAPSGQPENTVVWCSWDGSHVLPGASTVTAAPVGAANPVGGNY